MSKDKPEVGDVWISPKGIKIYITQVCQRFYVVTEKGIATTRFWADFNKNYTYLGKSKVKIEDLFKTDNKELLK